MGCCCCYYWYDNGRIVNVSKRVRSIHLTDRHRAWNTVHRCHWVACLKMFLHRLKLAHNSVRLYQQPQTRWPDNLKLIWVQLNLNLRPHHNPLVLCCHLCHCCWCWCCCHYYCCQRIRTGPPNHRRRGCQDFRVRYCLSRLLLLLLLLLAHPMPMSFFDPATTQPVHIQQKRKIKTETNGVPNGFQRCARLILPLLLLFEFNVSPLMCSHTLCTITNFSPISHSFRRQTNKN